MSIKDDLLRVAAIIAVLAGTAGSLALMFHVGQRNPSRALMSLFAIWVLSPFAALVLAALVSERWAFFTPKTLYSMMLLLTLRSLAAYGDIAFWRPRAKPASVFLLVPLASWLLIVIAAIISRNVRRRSLLFFVIACVAPHLYFPDVR